VEVIAFGLTFKKVDAQSKGKDAGRGKKINFLFPKNKGTKAEGL